MEVIYRKITELTPLPGNPRTITKKGLEQICDSMTSIPKYFEARPLILSNRTGQLVVIAGNQRMKAAKKLKMKEVPTVLLEGLTEEEEKEIILRDNINNGDWDIDALLSGDWDDIDFDYIGLELPQSTGSEREYTEDEEESEDERPEDEEGDEKEEFFRSMLDDCLYESNNIYDVPNLLKDKQATKLILPFAPWGADSRLRKDVSTYHFYVDDYRFEAIFKDPVKVLTSGVKQIVEPNLSLYDTTPTAYGLHLIYKKRWISRYFQECGILVYADLNVSVKFREYNKLGIPEGYNAFATRGYADRIEYLKNEYAVAKEISGLESPNMIVYGGGDVIREFCAKNSLIYVEQFINNKDNGKNKRR